MDSMDSNGLPLEGFPSVDLTAGYGVPPLTIESRRVSAGVPWEGDMQPRNGLSEAEKEKIILECKDAASEREVEKILERRVPDGEMSHFLDSVSDNIF